MLTDSRSHSHGCSLFAFFIIEMWLDHKMGGPSHSHGRATDAEFSGDAPAQRVLIRVRRKMVSDTGSTIASTSRSQTSSKKPISILHHLSQKLKCLHGLTASTDSMSDERLPFWLCSISIPLKCLHATCWSQLHILLKWMQMEADGDQQVDPLVHKKTINGLCNSFSPILLFNGQSLDISLLEGAFLFHSVFVGMTAPIMFHQKFEGLTLDSRIAAVPYPNRSTKPWLLVTTFGTTSPFGEFVRVVT
jgi:hypothetical protein